MDDVAPTSCSFARSPPMRHFCAMLSLFVEACLCFLTSLMLAEVIVVSLEPPRHTHVLMRNSASSNGAHSEPSFAVEPQPVFSLLPIGRGAQLPLLRARITLQLLPTVVSNSPVCSLSGQVPTWATSNSWLGDPSSRGIGPLVYREPQVSQSGLGISCCFDKPQSLHCLHSCGSRHARGDSQELRQKGHRRPESRWCKSKSSKLFGQTHSSSGRMFESVLSSKQGQQSVINLVKFLCVRSQSFRRDNATVKGTRHCTRQ